MAPSRKKRKVTFEKRIPVDKDEIAEQSEVTDTKRYNKTNETERKVGTSKLWNYWT